MWEWHLCSTSPEPCFLGLSWPLAQEDSNVRKCPCESTQWLPGTPSLLHHCCSACRGETDVWKTSRLFFMWIAQNLCENESVLITNLKQSYKVWVKKSFKEWQKKQSKVWKSSYASSDHGLKLPTYHSDAWSALPIQCHHIFFHCRTVFLSGHFLGKRRTVLPWKQNIEVKVHL